MANPLTVVPGTPGSGKSTALWNYPSSPAYRQYVAERRAHTNDNLRVSVQEPIVSMLTFNSAMNGGPSAFGLRIIFGALRSMRLLTRDNSLYEWEDFCTHFHSEVDLPALDAVQLLRAAFGQDRLMFVGVDELSQSGAADHVMREICVVLSNRGLVDIVVTALTPAYISTLMANTQRPIDYVVNPALLAPVKEYPPLAQELLDRAARDGLKMDKFGAGIIRAAPFLASGHPRTLELLVASAESGELYEGFIQPQLGGTGKFNNYSFLTQLAAQGVYTTYSIPPDTEEEMMLLLTARSYNAAARGSTDKLFRTMLEQMQCFVHQKVNNQFVPTGSLSSFFAMVTALKEMSPSEPLIAAASALFAGVRDLSTLWKRAVALSIVARARSLPADAPSVADVLGVKHFPVESVVERKIQVLVAREGTDTRYRPSHLVASKPVQPGWDLLLFSEDEDGSPRSTYIEVKVDLWDQVKLTVPGMVAHKITCILDDHFTVRATGGNEEAQLSSICVVFSVYPLNDSIERPLYQDKGAVLECIRTEAGTHKDASSEVPKRLERAIQYVERHYEANVRFVGKKEIERVTIPMLLPLVQLVQSVEGEKER